MSRPGSGMVEARRPWYLLTGLVVGLALGLVFAWVIYPVKYVDTAPQALRADFKARYRSLIAQAYAASGDLGRARARLALLGDADAMAALAAQAQQIVAAGGSQPEARSLALLASALGKPEGALLTEQPTALQPSPVSSETPTLTSTSTPVKSSPTATAAVTTTRRCLERPRVAHLPPSRRQGCFHHSPIRPLPPPARRLCCKIARKFAMPVCQKPCCRFTWKMPPANRCLE